MRSADRYAWVEVDDGRATENIKAVARAVGSADVCAVLKANAYGMGAAHMARVYAPHARMFAAATLGEALEIRESVPDRDVLVLGHVPQESYERAIEHGVSLTVWDERQFSALSTAARQVGADAKIHVKIETGMNRIGFVPTNEALDAIARGASMPGVELCGVFSHFATADEPDKSTTHEQAKLYMSAVSGLEARGVKIPIRHLANSPTITDLPEYHLDMVRAGLILTGFYTSETMDRARVPVLPAITLKARVVNIKRVPAGEGVGYGHTFRTERETVIATLPIGCSDGFSRCFGNGFEVELRGTRCPTIGNICMDQCMIDATDAPGAMLGDEVTIYGDGSGAAHTAEEAAEIRGTIIDEVLTDLSSRLPRIYTNGN